MTKDKGPIRKPDRDVQESGRSPLRRAVEFFIGPLEWRTLRDWAVLIVAILAFWWLLVQPFRIPSGSMEPTLHGGNFVTGDRVFVNKLSFGIKFPFLNRNLVTWGEPQRGDIVVFRSVEPESPRKILIKRIAGLPGERVQIRDGFVHVYNEAVGTWVRQDPEPGVDLPRYLSADDLESMIVGEPSGLTRERMLQLRDAYPYRYGCIDSPEYSEIPEGHYMMLGDNSANSIDSRIYGWVPRENILGRATNIFWPISRLRDFTGWTGTWWGKLLMIGIPLSIAILEFVRYRARQEADARTEAS